MAVQDQTDLSDNKQKNEYEDITMKMRSRIICIILGLCLVPMALSGQEEESAELYLDDYTTNFRKFFLKHISKKE